jgi:hypothetical protein
VTIYQTKAASFPSAFAKDKYGDSLRKMQVFLRVRPWVLWRGGGKGSAQKAKGFGIPKPFCN